MFNSCSSIINFQLLMEEFNSEAGDTNYTFLMTAACFKLVSKNQNKLFQVAWIKLSIPLTLNSVRKHEYVIRSN